MTTIDPDDLEAKTLSLCKVCAKHPSLERFVARRGRPDVRCGICLNASAEPITCDLSERKALTYLIRALVRFYYDESQFNSHFGADESCAQLLQADNAILESKSEPGFERSPDRSWVWLEDIFGTDIYPPYDEGVAYFAGFSEGDRMFNRSLQHSDDQLRTLRDRLQSENYFTVEPHLTALIERAETRIAVEEAAGQIYHRARLGVEGRVLRSDGFSSEIVYIPYQGAALAAPPPPIASAGRLNRAGVAFLYLASDIETACAEIRPHPSHHLSVGQFRSLRPLRLANLEADIADFATSDTELDLYAFIFAADQAMSLPTRPEDGSRYSVTQLFSDVLRARGFDGVAFKSSVNDGGRNVCVFAPDAFEYVEGSAVIREVKALHYDLKPISSTLAPESGDLTLP